MPKLNKTTINISRAILASLLFLSGNYIFLNTNTSAINSPIYNWTQSYNNDITTSSAPSNVNTDDNGNIYTFGNYETTDSESNYFHGFL